MAEWLVGRVPEFAEIDRKIVSVEGTDIGIFCKDKEFYAYENVCLHQGGPVCEGMLLGKVEQLLTEDRSANGHRFSEEEEHIVCPWHGWEYDIVTGRCAADRRLRLRRYKVVKRGEEVYVIK